MSTELTLTRARWAQDEATLQRLRETVFVHEQQVPPEIEWDGRDRDALHVIARDRGEAVACGRLLADGKIGRMAVLPAWRGRGVGAAVLAALIEEARQRGLRRVYLHAQAHAEGFYASRGFAAEGERFEEAGIPHVAMALTIDFLDCPVPVAPVYQPEPFATLVLSLARSARRQLALLSPALDPALFEPPGLREAITALCRETREAEVRILVADGRALTTRGSALLVLARRLPSKLSLRELPEHPQWPGDSCVIRDRDGLLALPADPLSGGSYQPDDRPRAAQALERFDVLWRQGQETPELRALHI
ncbi:GNAT family N-acetyltransferase [Pseudohaliea rubra]|uniref:GNAT family acetyltransferase YjcF n=1 Tax=Pseudohaliea rubra DSM 19751 TaxID=1265313 RepID=A0A095XUY3_9GAMM|nr:GNAT family N-acetyltransferase [Pseudohaliea rubra]KGE03501.1 GNAT family acetyltransferase YjcF [Pseudohaliea rubra DSM 19751]